MAELNQEFLAYVVALREAQALAEPPVVALDSTTLVCDDEEDIRNQDANPTDLNTTYRDVLV